MELGVSEKLLHVPYGAKARETCISRRRVPHPLLFLIRLAVARTVNPAPLPFTPQFSPFPAYYLTYPYWHAILSRVYRSSSSPKCRPGELLYLLRVIQPLYFRWFPHSFAQWTPRNPFAFKCFRTLSIATGLYTPLLAFQSCAPRAQKERTNCALSCPEPERGVRNNPFVCHTLAPREFEGCAKTRGGGTASFACSALGGEEGRPL
jgi:hypothetical protein